MRIPGWVVVPLLVTACSSQTPVDAVPPGATPLAPPPQVSATHVADMKRCEVLGDGTTGVVDYRLAVDASGQVQRVEAAQTPVSAAVINCSVQRARAWSFGATGKPETVTFRVDFDAPTPAAAPLPPASKAAMNNEIKHRASDLQHCYNVALRTNPTLAGKVEYRIVVALDGTVPIVEATHDPSLTRDVIDCTKEKIRGWVFPMEGARESADVRFSVVLSGS